jgi:hypothetical protein
VDFVTWIEEILRKIHQSVRPNSHDSTTGFPSEHIEAITLPPGMTRRADFWSSFERQGILWALEDLQTAGLIEQPGDDYYRLTRAGRQHLMDPLPTWQRICSESLVADETKALEIINRLSIRHTEDGGFFPAQVLRDEILREMMWPDSEGLRLDAAIDGLKRLAFVREIAPDVDVWATYAGAVWDMRRGETNEARFIDGLIAEGETTNNEFKRELHLDTKDEKAEFVRDVLGLANTKTSGKRWLIIGIDDKSLAYHGAPDPKISQNRLEHILSDYSAPQIQVHYSTVLYRGNIIGKLEVHRTRSDLPYKVAKSVGDKKRIAEGTIYVRHGSQTEKPTPAEEEALLAEGDHARARNE